MRHITRRSVAATGLAATALAAGPDRAAAAPTAAPPETLKVHHRSVTVDGVSIFYREAGPRDAPALLLLHGFPSSSHMFRQLIPALADRFRVIAPDYPGFGRSDAPPRGRFAYRFDHLYALVDGFTRAVGLERFAIYIQDYGAPIGLRFASRQPERVSAIIVQNGNAYDVGLGPVWAPIRRYWDDPSPANRAALRSFLGEEATRWQYTHGVADLSLVDPESWSHDQRGLDRPGNDEIQLDLLGDYASNLKLYPAFQQALRERQFPTLITWGQKDEIFLAAGGEAYLEDLPDAEIHRLDAGHFALETHGPEIAALIRAFLDRTLRG